MVAVRKEYVPERGDVIWITFDPIRGHEQQGRRPAFVLSPSAYNEKVGLAIVCPVTSTSKGYPFEVDVPFIGKGSVILVDQIRSIDWRHRKAEYYARTPSRVMQEVSKLIQTLLKL